MNPPRLLLIALACPEPFELAQFYAALTAIAVETWPGCAPEETPGIDSVHDSLPALSFQRVEDYVAPTWPEGAMPKQVHLDFEVNDLDEGARHARSAGARKAEYRPGETFRAFPDPVGQPFCLVLRSDEA